MAKVTFRKGRNRLGKVSGIALIAPAIISMFLLLLLVSPVRTALSANFSVTNTNDAGPGSLRAAISDAISDGNPAFITFNLSYPAKIILASSLPTVTTAITIQGPAGDDTLVISGANQYRIFNVSGINGANGNLTLENLTLSDGLGLPRGGAIYNDSGTITVANSTLTFNAAKGFNSIQNAASGGSIYSKNGATYISNSVFSNNSSEGLPDFGDEYAGAVYVFLGGLSIENSIFTNNKVQAYNLATNSFAGAIMCDNCTSFNLNNSRIENNVVGTLQTSWAVGGGVVLQSTTGAKITDSSIDNNQISGTQTNGGGIGLFSSSLTLINSTISNNQGFGGVNGSGLGGGIQFSDANSTLTMINSTVAYNKLNSTDTSTEYYGGGVFSNTGLLTIVNTIIANNSVLTGAKGNDIYGSMVTSNGFNIIGDTTGTNVTAATGDKFNVDPKLGTLEDNGGPTPTIELLPGSPAIDSGSSSICSDGSSVKNKDQRGFTRNVGASCDIGAYEFPPTLTVTNLDDNLTPAQGSLRKVASDAGSYDQARIVFDPSLGNNAQINLVTPLTVPANTRIEGSCTNQVELNGTISSLVLLEPDARLQGLILQSTTGPVLNLNSGNHRFACVIVRKPLS